MSKYLLLLSMALVGVSSEACVPENYQFGVLELTYDGQLIKKFPATGPGQPEYFDSIGLEAGDELKLNASGDEVGVSKKLEVKFLKKVKARMGEESSSVYRVIETISANGADSQSRKYRLTVAHIEGTRSLDGCSRVIKEDVEAKRASTSSNPMQGLACERDCPRP